MRSFSLLMVSLVGVSFACAACDKIPGLGKKGDDGGTTASGGGGVFSFLSGTFEGEITMKVSGAGGAGGPRELVFGVKSPKLRVDAAGGAPGNPALAQGSAFIVDPPAKKAYALIPAQKKAMLIDLDKAKAGAAVLPGVKTTPGAAVPSDPPKIEKTGKKAVIAGYECEEWKVTSKTSRADICVAEGIKWVDLGDLGLSYPEVALAAATTDVNRFPLRVVGYDAKGTETSRMEATKIDKKTLDAARFVVPPDYQVIDMSTLLGGIGQIPGGKLPPGFVPPKPK